MLFYKIVRPRPLACLPMYNQTQAAGQPALNLIRITPALVSATGLPSITRLVLYYKLNYETGFVLQTRLRN